MLVVSIVLSARASMPAFEDVLIIDDDISCEMDEEVLNIQVRKFLKKVGIQSQREIEQAVKDHLKKGSLTGIERLDASMLLEVPEIDLKFSIDGKIELE